jgi:hypothetical protein
VLGEREKSDRSTAFSRKRVPTNKKIKKIVLFLRFIPFMYINKHARKQNKIYGLLVFRFLWHRTGFVTTFLAANVFSSSVRRNKQAVFTSKNANWGGSVAVIKKDPCSLVAPQTAIF